MVNQQGRATAEALRSELARLLERRTGSDGRHETAIPELKLYRFSQPTEPAPFLQEPAVYVVVQGRKQVTVGDETYLYDRSQYLAVSVDLPVVAHVAEASPEEPYFCMTLTVDPRELAALIVETGRQAPRDDHDGRALYVSPLQAPLLDGFLRLVRLLDAPQDISVLAPLILRELHYVPRNKNVFLLARPSRTNLKPDFSFVQQAELPPGFVRGSRRRAAAYTLRTGPG
jgi:AraC-type transcriptional regulator N-terminus